MDATPEKPPLPLEFTVRQTDLIQELSGIARRFPLGEMLKGGLMALNDDRNPEAFVHASQSLRELIEKFELEVNQPNEDTEAKDGAGQIKSKAKEFSEKWSLVKEESGCYAKRGPAWTGTIDPPLVRFLTATEEFLDWYGKNPVYLKNKETAVLVRLDPMFSMLSQNDQEQIAREWVSLRKFFVMVAHHRSKVTRAEMDDYANRLEGFLHRRLLPTEAENKNAILALIAKVEKRDN